MKQLLCLFLLVLFNRAQAQPPIEARLDELNDAIRQSATYDSAKAKQIKQLRQQLAAIAPNDLSARFNANLALYEAYKLYRYDSAYSYVRQLQQTAYLLNDPIRINQAGIKLSFILLSSGMFKESYDSLRNIHFEPLPQDLRAEYFLLMARYYYDIADYVNDQFHTPGYMSKGNMYIDSALQLLPTRSFDYLYYIGLRNIRNHRRAEAGNYFWQLLRDTTLTSHQVALTASTLADNYIQNGKTDSAMQLLVQAAVADIRSSTKETAAIFHLASLLFKQGDLQSASTYIEKAVNDAFSYGARQRKIQVSALLPLIEGEKMNRVQSEKKTLITYAAIVTLLLMVLVALVVVIFRQLRKLKQAQQIITEAHLKQQEINNKLLEANKFKDEYIGYFFNGNSEFYAKMEKFKKNLESKVQDRKLEEIRVIAHSINIKKEKEELVSNFDRIFLKLFPHFVESYNALFAPEDRIQLKEHELLNTDLRIFALIRMGVHDSEKIARILEYSVNTINTYKTKIKNRSIIPNEEFEHRIMDIKSI